MLFIGGAVSIFYRVELFCVPLDSLFSLIISCVCWLFTLCMSCLCQYVTKRGRNYWFMGIMFVLFRGSWNYFLKGENINKNFFVVSNLGGELVYFCFYFCFLFTAHWFIFMSYSWYMSLFCVLWSQEFTYWFTVFLSHMRLCVCWVFQEYTGAFDLAAVYTCNWWIVVKIGFVVMSIIFVLGYL